MLFTAPPPLLVWLPAEIRREWSYVYVRERSRKTGDDPPLLPSACRTSRRRRASTRAAGVGRVLVKEDLVQTMLLQDGRRLEYRERIQYALHGMATREARATPIDREESSASR